MAGHSSSHCITVTDLHSARRSTAITLPSLSYLPPSFPNLFILPAEKEGQVLLLALGSFCLHASNAGRSGAGVLQGQQRLEDSEEQAQLLGTAASVLQCEWSGGLSCRCSHCFRCKDSHCFISVFFPSSFPSLLSSPMRPCTASLCLCSPSPRWCQQGNALVPAGGYSDFSE